MCHVYCCHNDDGGYFACLVCQVRVSSPLEASSQPCAVDTVPTLQMGTLRLEEAKDPSWDSEPWLQNLQALHLSTCLPFGRWVSGSAFPAPLLPTRWRRPNPLCGFTLPRPPLAPRGSQGLRSGLVVGWVHVPDGSSLQALAVSLPPAVALGELASFHIHHLDLKSGDSHKAPTWGQAHRGRYNSYLA